MTEKTSHLLSCVKDLLKDQKFHEALSICEDILNNDENNITALLMSTKCLMELDQTPNKVKIALERVLSLKAKHPTATQGLRKFYEKNFRMFFDDAFEFYYDLLKSNELSATDIAFITIDLAKQPLPTRAEELIVTCLATEITAKRDEDCLMTYFNICVEKYIGVCCTLLINAVHNHLVTFESNEESEKVVYVRNMITFVKAVLDGKSPEIVFGLMTELSIKNAYASIIFGKLLCNHYMMQDCEDTIVMGLDQLQNDIVYNRNSLLVTANNIRIENLIHLGDINNLEKAWSEVEDTMIAKYLWCQSFAMGFNKFAAKMPPTWCIDMSNHQRSLCLAIMDDKLDITELQPSFTETIGLTSFEWYLWATVLQTRDRPVDSNRALQCGLKQRQQVYYKILVQLSKLCSQKRDYCMAVTYLEKALEVYFALEVVEALVDLHMTWQKYEEPLALLEILDTENCSDTLLLKFISCLRKLERITDAISLAQRIAQKCPSRSEYWQLLGDLYLQRDNVNHAFKTYQKCIQLSGETCDNCARLGNVFSLSYQDTLEENEFVKSLSFFNKSLALATCKEAIEGKASLLYLHADVALKQLMLSSAIRDTNEIIGLLTGHCDELKDSGFPLNMLGKTMLLCVMGSIDKMIDIGPVKTTYFPDVTESDCCDLSMKCFETCIRHYSHFVEPHYNCGLLELGRLNRKCNNGKRGQLIDGALYSKTEAHFKSALSMDQKCSEAWKYLGYLYLRHGTNTEKLAFEIQHCFSMAINASSNIDRINDPESAFYLGLLYIRENWFELAREVFEKIKMDYPVDAIGYIGLYLLADKDHTVEQQPEIARALMSYVYRDETTNINDSCHQLTDGLVGLFAENMGFLVHSYDSNVIFDGRVDSSSLVMALRTAMSSVWTKYLAYSSVGSIFTEEEEKRFKEYGCFLGIIELLLGDFQYGKKLVLKSTVDADNDKLQNLLHLDQWVDDNDSKNVELILSLSKSLSLKLNQDNIVTNKAALSMKAFDEMLLSAIVDHMTHHSSRDNLVSKYIDLVIQAIPSLCTDYQPQTIDQQVSLILGLGSFLITINDRHLTMSFLAVISRYYGHLIDNDERIMRVICRLRIVQSSVTDVYKYLYEQCLKQPMEMNRWLNLLEFGLDYCEQLSLDGTVTMARLFFVSNRPWCMAPLDIERYARILATHTHSITTDALAAHRLMLFKTAKLFPASCLPLMRRLAMI